MSKSTAILAHFIHENGSVVSKRVIEFAPSSGDELRFSGEAYYKVTRLIWIYDEPESQLTRLNVGIVDAS